MDQPTSFMSMYGLRDTSVDNIKKVESVSNPQSHTKKEKLIENSDSDSEEEIDVEYIIENCPKTSIVREFMKVNLKNNDEPDWL